MTASVLEAAAVLSGMLATLGVVLGLTWAVVLLLWVLWALVTRSEDDGPPPGAS